MTYRSPVESEEGIRLSGSKCIVCGWAKKRSNGKLLVEGAHIRPYNSGKEFDSRDNIIALCPNHHTEYDAYNYYIDCESKKLVFKDENDEYNGKDVSENIRHIKKEYLAYAQYLFNLQQE